MEPADASRYAGTGKKRLAEAGEKVIDWIIDLVEKSEPVDYFPEDYAEAYLYEPETSRGFFLALENLTDGMGGWNLPGVLGCAWKDLPGKTQHDLYKLRELYQIARRQKDRRKSTGNKVDESANDEAT